MLRGIVCVCVCVRVVVIAGHGQVIIAGGFMNNRGQVYG